MPSDDADNKTKNSKPPARRRRDGKARPKSRSLPTPLISMYGGGDGDQDRYHADDRSVDTTSSGTSLIRLYRSGGSVANKGSLRSVSENFGGGKGSDSSNTSLSMLLNSVSNSKRSLQRHKQQEQQQTPHPHPQQKQQDPHERGQRQHCATVQNQRQRAENDGGSSSDNNHHLSSSSSFSPSCSSSSVEENAVTAENKKNMKHGSVPQASSNSIRQLSPVSETGGVLQHRGYARRLNTINAAMATMGVAAELDNQSINSMPSLASYNSESHRSMPSLASFNSESMRSRKSISMMSTTSSYSMDTPSDDSCSSLVTNDSSICSFSQYSVLSSKSNTPKNNPAGGNGASAAPASGGSSSSTSRSNVTSSSSAVKASTDNNNINKAVLANKSNSYSSSGSSVSSGNNSRIMARFVGGLRARNVSVPVPSNADVVEGKTLDYIESAPLKQPQKEEEQEKRKQRWGGTKNKVDAMPMAIVRQGSELSPITRSKSESNYFDFSLTRNDASKRDLIPKLAQRRSSKEYSEALQQQQQQQQPRDVLPQQARRRNSKEYEQQSQSRPLASAPPKSRDVLPNIVRRRGSLDYHDVAGDEVETMIQKINV